MGVERSAPANLGEGSRGWSRSGEFDEATGGRRSPVLVRRRQRAAGESHETDDQRRRQEGAGCYSQPADRPCRGRSWSRQQSSVARGWIIVVAMASPAPFVRN